MGLARACVVAGAGELLGVMQCDVVITELEEKAVLTHDRILYGLS
jgi:hypothetical protein